MNEIFDILVLLLFLGKQRTTLNSLFDINIIIFVHFHSFFVKFDIKDEL